MICGLSLCCFSTACRYTKAVCVCDGLCGCYYKSPVRLADTLSEAQSSCPAAISLILQIKL